MNNDIKKLVEEKNEIEHAIEMLTFDYEQDFSDAIERKQIRIEEINVELEKMGYNGEDIDD